MVPLLIEFNFTVTYYSTAPTPKKEVTPKLMAFAWAIKSQAFYLKYLSTTLKRKTVTKNPQNNIPFSSVNSKENTYFGK